MDLPERVDLAAAKPVSDMTPADLRLLVAQQVRLDEMVPCALDIVYDHPLIEAQFYPGDLLNTLLNLPADYWSDHQGDWQKLHSVLDALDRTLAGIADARAHFLKVAS